MEPCKLAVLNLVQECAGSRCASPMNVRHLPALMPAAPVCRELSSVAEAAQRDAEGLRSESRRHCAEAAALQDSNAGLLERLSGATEMLAGCQAAKASLESELRAMEIRATQAAKECTEKAEAVSNSKDLAKALGEKV